MRRVVITGIGGITALGHDWASIEQSLRGNESAVAHLPVLDEFPELRCRLGAPVADFIPPPHFSRKVRRTMGRVSLMAVRAAELAIEQAGLTGADVVSSGAMGVACGSSTGSTDATQEFTAMLEKKSLEDLNATSYVRMMSHTAAVNTAIYFKLKGRVITTSSACTSGSQGLGYAYEAIKHGKQQLMIAGGAEEFCPSEVAVFDTLFATSTRNDAPTTTPRPFDRERDGLVIGEGACMFVLEELEHARARDACIIGEVAGFGTNCDGDHVTRPNKQTMRRAMELALEDAGLQSADIGYVNAHATATEHGDIAESQATFEVFGGDVPVSSLKGHIGHTLGACGSIETWAALEMLHAGWVAPTLNLDEPDERCAPLDYVRDGGRSVDCELAVCNNFAFGGINTSLVLRRW